MGRQTTEQILNDLLGGFFKYQRKERYWLDIQDNRRMVVPSCSVDEYAGRGTTQYHFYEGSTGSSRLVGIGRTFYSDFTF